VISESKACSRHRSGNGKEAKAFDVLEWLAVISSHVPYKGEQMIRKLGVGASAIAMVLRRKNP